MRARCNNPRSADYSYYGGRGISICKRWDSFENFAADMGPHPGKGWTLDRINNNGNYEPANCRWATRAMQSRNRRTTKLTSEKVTYIRRRYVRGVNQVDTGNSAVLAIELGVSQVEILNVARRAFWK
jgi:hypothetical protein